MAAKDRIDKICKESGFSEEIVRKVLSAETQVAVDEMRHGRVAVLSGRAKLEPIETMKLVDGKLRKVIKVRAQVLKSIESKLSDTERFIIEEKSDEETEKEMRELVLNSIGSEDKGNTVVLVEDQIGALL